MTTHIINITSSAAPVAVKAGSLVLCESPDIIGRAIRLGEWIRWRGGCRWNHAAIAIEDGDNPLVVQATGHGVSGTQRLHDLQGGFVAVIPPPLGVNSESIVRFATEQIGDHYGFLTIAGIVASQLSPSFLQFQTGRYNTWICSALAAESWRCGGWVYSWPDIYAVSPAQLALAVGVPANDIFPPATPKQTKEQHGDTDINDHAHRDGDQDTC